MYMVCTVCGHANSEHKSVTSALFYCSNCKVLEEGVTFTVEAAGNSDNSSDPSKSSDVQTDLYRSMHRKSITRYE